MLTALANWLAELPTTLAVLIAMAAGGGLAALGLLGAHPVLPYRLRSTHNDVSGFILAIVGVIYAVLLAFIAVAVWQNYGQSETLVQTEANLVGDLYRDTAALPEPTAARLRNFLFIYAEVVVQDEWPGLAQENGTRPRAGSCWTVFMPSCCSFTRRTSASA